MPELNIRENTYDTQTILLYTLKTIFYIYNIFIYNIYSDIFQKTLGFDNLT